MNKATISETPTAPGVDYEAEIDRYLAQVKQIHSAMAQSQNNIEKLRAETRSTLSDINAALDKLAA